MDAKNGMRPVHPGEILRRRTGRARAVGQCVGKGAGCTGEPDHTDPARPAGGDGRYGATASTVFWDDATAVAEPAADLGVALCRD